MQQSQWKDNVKDAPHFIFGDLYNYLVLKAGYDKEAMAAFKSLQGYRLYYDGHVEELAFHSIEEMDYSFLNLA